MKLEKVVDDRLAAALPELAAWRGKRVALTVVPEGEVERGHVVFGALRETIRVGDDFDAPLPDEVACAFEGDDAPSA